MKIIYCSDAHSQMWDSFLQEVESSSFYHLFGWKEINEESFGHETFYLSAVEGEKIVGIFPMVYFKSRLFGKILCSMPFVNYGGPCSLNSEIEAMLLQEAISISNKNSTNYFEIRGIKKVNDELPTSLHKISMTLNLDRDPDVLWRAFKTGHRTNIRRAYKNDLSVRMGGIDMLDVFYKILSESWRNLGTPVYQKEYFKKILASFSDSVKIFVVYHNNIPIATAFNGYFKKTVEGMWAGIIEKYKRLEPNYVLYWEMIKHACENGFKTFHLGRSSVDSGGEIFKKKWNADSRQLYWQYFLNGKKEMPQLNVNNPKYYFAIQTWKRLPLRLTNFIGPFISKNIP